MKKSLAVIHLVRYRNGVTPLTTFIASYLKNRPAIGHDIIILCKGFPGKTLTDSFTQCLQSLRYRPFFVNDWGGDLHAYVKVARDLPHDYLCFLNSYSILLDAHWLEKLHDYITRPRIGLAGATGSWESSPHVLESVLRDGNLNLFHQAVRSLKLARLEYLFPPFPNVHIRSNSFIIPRQLFNQLRTKPMLTKTSNLRFESGWNSITRQIMERGYEPIIVGRDGLGYPSPDWPWSRTFRSYQQENLLVADNRTLEYQEADPTKRRLLSIYAWGRDYSNGSIK